MDYPTDILIGIIGGSGVYKMDCLEHPKPYKITTPFGDPSDSYIVATVSGIKCAFLPRHGAHHIYLPSEVNYRANIFGFKLMGVKYILSISACGSLTKEYVPGQLAVVDQLIDKTFARQSTFFGNGIVAHIPFANPVCHATRKVALAAIRTALNGSPDSNKNVKVHDYATLVTMEGPAFSTKADSLLNHNSGAHLIGMTTSTEAKLAREAEIAFVVVSMVTDNDAWLENEHVDVAKVMKTMADNTANAQTYTKAVIEAVGKAQPASEAHSALAVAIMTHMDHIPNETLQKLKPLIGKYVN